MNVTGPSKAKEDQFQTEDDLRTLERASEVMSDKSRHMKAKKLHSKRSQSLKTMLTRR